MVLTLYAADHFSFKMSRQIFPCASTFGWKHLCRVRARVREARSREAGDAAPTARAREAARTHGVANLMVGAVYG